ncbi:UNVERIFIED_CONTAM: hypothetical protein Scaly_2977200 [Sesamum calycinum]|uniref:Uncharacterized protein n=1 Tax=Sesamum calycinum TaxID=2727403 RepID=A0AAW2KMH0_9LAMI
MCAGRATHQPTSNGGENIACRNKSLIRGVSNAVCSKNKSPLAPRDGSGGRPYAQATAAPALRKKERNRYVSDGVYIVHRAPKRFLGQLSSLIHRSNALGSSHGGKSQNVVVLFAASTHSLLSPVPHRKKSAEPRPDLCTNDNSKRHTSAAYLPFRWHQRDPAKVRSCRGCSTPLRSDELNFVAFPPAKRMGAVPWVSFGTESEERPEE